MAALVGWPGANRPNHLVPGEQAGQLPESRPGPGPRGDTRRPAGRTADHPAVGDDHNHRSPGGVLDPVEELVGPVVSTLLP